MLPHANSGVMFCGLETTEVLSLVQDLTPEELTSTPRLPGFLGSLGQPGGTDSAISIIQTGKLRQGGYRHLSKVTAVVTSRERIRIRFRLWLSLRHTKLPC